MKILVINHRMGASMRHTVHDDATAAKAYDAIRDAMASYREFGNDKNNTIEVELDSGSTTIRLSELAQVTLDAIYEPGDPMFVERANNQAALDVEAERIRRKAYVDAGLPYPDEKASG